MLMKRLVWRCIAAFFILCICVPAYAQTDMDADMMNKNLFCTGVMYASGKWDNYWEGTLKRENLNIGTVSTKMVALMGNYGISKKIEYSFQHALCLYESFRRNLTRNEGIAGFEHVC